MALDKDIDTHTLALIITHSPKFIKSFRIVQVAAVLREDSLEYNGPACRCLDSQAHYLSSRCNEAITY